MIGIRSIARRAASKVVPLGAFRSTAGVSHHTIPTPTNSTIPKNPLFSRLFSSSLRRTPEYFQSHLRDWGMGDELKVDKHEKSIRFAIGEVGDNLVLEVKGQGEISSVEVPVPDDDADKLANLSDGNINFPFVIRAPNLEMHCTCYPDTICVDRVIRDKDSVFVPCNQINMDMPVGVVGKMHLVASGVINPVTIRYLRELKLELNEFKKCFVLKPEEEFLWSFFSSILDYAARRRFDFCNVCSYKKNPSWVEDDSDNDYDMINDQAFLYDDEGGKHFIPHQLTDRLFHVMTREDKKDEVTIWVEVLTHILADFDEACNQRFVRFMFGLLINGTGTCLQFHCFAYPDGKIKIDALEIVDDWKHKDCVTAGERIDTTFLDGKSVSHKMDLNPNDDPPATRRGYNETVSVVLLSPYAFL